MMITVLTGENSFEIERALESMASDFNGRVERINADNLCVADLPDLLMGVSLFADKRTIIIRGLSENKAIWPVFGNWLDKISDDIHLVLAEPKLDKRTVIYKSLKDKVSLREFPALSDRDIYSAEKWVSAEAEKLGFALDKKCAQVLVERIGIDQWQLFHALEKLALVDSVTPAVISEIIESNPSENAFNLLETAIRGDVQAMQTMLHSLQQTEDVYKLFGLLSVQVFQLAVVFSAESAGQRSNNPAKDFGIHPYVVSKLTPLARKLGKNGISNIVELFAKTDEAMKSSATDGWLLIENCLLKITSA